MKLKSIGALLVLVSLFLMGSGWDSRNEVQGKYWVARSFTVASGDTMVRFPKSSYGVQNLVDTGDSSTWVLYLDFTSNQACSVIAYCKDAPSDSMRFLSSAALSAGGGFSIPPVKSGIDSVRIIVPAAAIMSIQGWK